jgi:hypothetical protein
MHLTSAQTAFIRENCSQWMRNPLALSRSGKSGNARLYTVHKVRWRDELTASPVVREALAEALPVGGVHFVERTITVDWGNGGTDGTEWIIPVGDQWSCYPLALLSLPLTDRTLVNECVSVALEGVDKGVEKLIGDRIRVGLVGVKKFITIKRRAFPTIDSLLKEINGNINNK